MKDKPVRADTLMGTLRTKLLQIAQRNRQAAKVANGVALPERPKPQEPPKPRQPKPKPKARQPQRLAAQKQRDMRAQDLGAARIKVSKKELEKRLKQKAPQKARQPQRHPVPAQLQAYTFKAKKDR